MSSREILQILSSSSLHAGYQACDSASYNPALILDKLKESRFTAGQEPISQQQLLHLADQSIVWHGSAKVNVDGQSVPFDIWLNFYNIHDCRDAILESRKFKKSPTVAVDWSFPTDDYLTSRSYEHQSELNFHFIGKSYYLYHPTYKNFEIGKRVAMILVPLPNEDNVVYAISSARQQLLKTEIKWKAESFTDYIRASEALSEKYNRGLAAEAAEKGEPPPLKLKVEPFKYKPRPPCSDYL